MNKVTVEEAMSAHKRNTKDVTTTFEVDIDGMNRTVINDDAVTVLNFLLQHKVPTFDEVVKDWENIGYSVSVNYDNWKEITSVMKNGKGDRKYLSFMYEECTILFGQFVYNLTKEELDAINLTIRFLEAQKHDDL